MDAPTLREQLLLLARNQAWTWSPPLQALFHRLPTFRPDVHPVGLVGALAEDQLTALTGEDAFIAEVAAEIARLEEMTGSVGSPEIAYFSPEFGISELVPQYSGGLGILAGDHLKAASDLRLPLAGIGLFYRQGFFHQRVIDGEQAERYEACDPESLGCADTGVMVEVPVGARTVRARVWRLDVGSVPLVVLDTDVAGNHADDRMITDRLYSGDRRHRIRQELVLGVGGARAVDALGWTPQVHHLNEGHAGFLILELLDRRIAAGHSLSEALDAIGPGLVFTTHTPVPAGIDRFERPLATEHLQWWATKWNVPVGKLLMLGAEGPSVDETTFNMANFCLRIAGHANGVSKLHGQVSRTLFADVPNGDNIGSITNGVHARTWVHPPVQEVFDAALGSAWADGDVEAWNGVDRIADDTIRSLRVDGRAELAEVVRDRLGVDLDSDALTVGFARRFATYKRADLLLRELDRLVALLADDDRPVQFVFAGKAHPADVPGKALLAEIAQFASSAEANGRFVFVPDYDMAVARAMYAGCDVWLNNPVRPREASGTSGEKSALNGGLNCSIADGWWAEMADDRNGWTIAASNESDAERRDAAESAAILTLLEDAIMPLFYEGAAHRPSAAWIERVRHCWRTLGPQVTAARMVRDYRDELYIPAGAGSLV